MRRGTNRLAALELRAVYRYLCADISQKQLSDRLKRTRTNTYYYIGRAVHYWVLDGTLEWNENIKSSRDIHSETSRTLAAARLNPNHKPKRKPRPKKKEVK